MSIHPQTARPRATDADTVTPADRRPNADHESPREQQATIERAAHELEQRSREERAAEPSARFWSSRRAQAGPVLALFAGVVTLAFRTWPIATPQGRGSLGIFWFLAATLVGALYISGFFLADRRWKIARGVLFGGALLHLAIAVTTGLTVDAQQIAPGLGALLFDIVPASMAIIAGFLMAPPPATLHHDKEAR